MTLLWTDLTYAQIHLHNRLDRRGWQMARRINSEEPGLEVSDLRQSEIRPMRQMMQLGLIQADAGWRGTGWIRLTAAGRRIRDDGQTD